MGTGIPRPAFGRTSAAGQTVLPTVDRLRSSVRPVDTTHVFPGFTWGCVAVASVDRLGKPSGKLPGGNGEVREIVSPAVGMKPRTCAKAKPGLEVAARPRPATTWTTRARGRVCATPGRRKATCGWLGDMPTAERSRAAVRPLDSATAASGFVRFCDPRAVQLTFVYLVSAALQMPVSWHAVPRLGLVPFCLPSSVRGQRDDRGTRAFPTDRRRKLARRTGEQGRGT